MYIGQVCESVLTAPGRHRLVTVKYTYTLTPEGMDEPLWRWEYVRDQAPDDRWCRHHLQGEVPLTIGRASVSLNDLHLPTGYVTVEEILRFCITDLRVRPLSGDWHRLLEESHRLFKTEFAVPGE